MENTVLFFKNDHGEPLPAEFQGEDIRLTPDFVRYILEQYTREGGIVLDPFAGYATTLIVAETMNRACYGIEADRRRYEYGLSKLKRPDLFIHGSALNLLEYPIPALDLVLFSPPYMEKSYDRNPLRGDLQQPDCYSKYLEDLLLVGRSAWSLLKHDGHLIVEVSNLAGESGCTTLAWDIATKFGKEFPFVKEKIVHWGGGYGYGYDHSYCLIFKKCD